MATRLYPLNQTAPYSPATIRGTWNDTASLVTKKLGTVKFLGDTNANVSKAETSTTNPYSVGLLRFVSDALPTARTLTSSDTFTVCMGCYESSNSANDYPKITIYVTAGDSDTVRGYLKQDWVGGTEWTTTAGYRSTGAIALAGTVAAEVGDRIVVVLGYSAANTSATSYAGQMWYGAGTAMADGVAAGTTHTTTAGWIEFSGNNMFAQAQPATLPLNLLTDVGNVQEDYSNAADWTVVNGAASDNTTEFRTGTQSVKITGMTATDCTATKTINWDLSGNFHRLQLWYYLHNPAADYPAGVQFYLSSTTGFTKTFWQEAYNTYFRQGWNVLTFDQSDLINAGTDSWASARIRLRVEFTSATGKAAAISFDSLTLNQIAVPAVMLHFDDATTTQYTVCFPYMQSYGIKGTIFCDTSQIDQAGSLTSAQLAAVDAAGWTVGNHTNSASGLGGQTEAAQEAQILGGKTALTALGLTRGVNYVAYPSGTFDLNTDIAMANLGMLFGRTTEPSDGSGEIRQALPWGDWYHVPTRASTALTLATAKTAVDKAIADGYIQPIHFHMVGAGDWSTADFQALIDYIAVKGVACITADDFYQLSQGPLGGTTLTVADSSHAHSVEAPSLTQAYSLTVADAGHAHSAAAPVLTQAHSLTVAASDHVHAAENVTLASSITLTVADSNHAHAAESVPTLFADLDEIQRSAGGEDSYVTVQHLAAGVDTWDDVGPFTGGEVYWYRGRHWTGTAAGDWSTSVSVTYVGTTDLVVADSTHAHTAEASVLAQAHSLTVADAGHAHSVDALALTQVHSLTVADLAHVHSADAPALTQTHSLTVGASDHGHAVEGVTLTQAHSLTVADSGHAQSVDSPVLAQDYLLAVAAANHAHAADNVTLSLAVSLTVADSDHAHSAASPVLTQAHALTVAPSDHAHTTEAPALTQAHSLSVADSNHSHSTESTSLTQAHSLTAADSAHAHTVESLALTQTHSLTVGDSTHVHSVDSPALTQAHTLAVAASDHAHTVVNVTLGAADTLVVEDSSHASSVESATLTQAHNLTVADSSQSHSAETPTLVQAFTLTVADSGHAHTAAAPILTQAHVLTVADSGHVHSAESPALVQAFTLVVADVAHSHSADAPTLAQAHSLTVAASTHVHQADNVTLGTADTLAVADVMHTHSAASPALTQLHNLVVADPSHAHSVDAVLLTQAHSLTVADSAHAHSSENVTLTFGVTLTVADVAHGHSVEAVTLTQNHVLTVDAATHAHTAESVALAQWHALVVAAVDHVHTADSPSLGQDYALTVANVSHALTMDGVVLVDDSAIVPFRVFVVQTRPNLFTVVARPTALTVQARPLEFVVTARPTTLSVPARNLTFTVVKR